MTIVAAIYQIFDTSSVSKLVGCIGSLIILFFISITIMNVFCHCPLSFTVPVQPSVRCWYMVRRCAVNLGMFDVRRLEIVCMPD